MIYCGRVKKIDSPQNPLIKHVSRLLRDGGYRHRHGEFVVEGYRVFDSAVGVKTLLLREGAAAPTRGWDGAEAVSLAPRVFDSLADTGNPQGALAVCVIPDPGVFAPGGRYLFLDGLQDPGNLGTLLRAAAAFRLAGVVCRSGSADPFGPKAARAAAGAVFRIPIRTDGDLSFLEGRRVIAAEVGGAALPDFPAPDDFVLVVGNEGGGISREVSALCGEGVAVPMPGGTESLNAAVSGCIILYAFTVGRGPQGGVCPK